ncbi:hypothetical protein [uncultured Dokdonia sp.]|uniref:hypothetical protein n=1 Tax=uncultured Dokdonia sp. TaxID=575653 RepID=UPI0026097321|nr:hypothetical protein [uncultured Dokdonia sp.]
MKTEGLNECVVLLYAFAKAYTASIQLVYLRHHLHLFMSNSFLIPYKQKTFQDKERFCVYNRMNFI